MPEEFSRTTARKKIILPGGDTIYVPVITKISFIDPFHQYQEYEYQIDNTDEVDRTVHVDPVVHVDVDQDGVPTEDNPTAEDTSDPLYVERIDTWNVIDPFDRHQESRMTLDNTTGNDQLPPHFSNHVKTHIYRYHQDPENPDDGGVWVDSELLDEFAVIDPFEQSQERRFILTNPTNAEFRDGDLSGQAGVDDPDITIIRGEDEGEGTSQDNPVRLDPYQNIINWNAGGYYISIGFAWSDLVSSQTVPPGTGISHPPRFIEVFPASTAINMVGHNIRTNQEVNRIWEKLVTTPHHVDASEGTPPFLTDTANAYDYNTYTYNAVFSLGTLSSTNPDEYLFTSAVPGQAAYELGYNETNFSGGFPVPRRQEVEGFAGGPWPTVGATILDKRYTDFDPETGFLTQKDTGVPDNNNWENILFNFHHSPGNPTDGTTVTIPAEDFRYNGPMGSGTAYAGRGGGYTILGVFEGGQVAFKLKSEGLVTTAEAEMFNIDADVPKVVIYPTVPVMRSIDHAPGDALFANKDVPYNLGTYRWGAPWLFDANEFIETITPFGQEPKYPQNLYHGPNPQGAST